MEKLVKLLNEYHFSGTEYVGYFLDEDENRIYFRTKVIDKGLVDEQRISDERIISKRFGFIKWLVDNDKIDVNKVKKEFYNNICITEYGDEDRAMGDDNLVIAVLSISDSPIEFLCSILK